MTTGTLTSDGALGRGAIERWVGTSAANTAQTISTAATATRRLLWAACHYSAAPTQTGVTTVLNSGAGSAYDTTLNTGTANAQDTVYIPTQDLIILPDDTIDVTGPAAGGTITSSIIIVTELL